MKTFEFTDEEINLLLEAIDVQKNNYMDWLEEEENKGEDEYDQEEVDDCEKALKIYAELEKKLNNK